MEEKLSTIYLVSGQTALEYLMNVSKKYRQIATEAIFECLRLWALLCIIGFTSAIQACLIAFGLNGLKAQ